MPVTTISDPLRAAVLAALYWHECRSDPAIAYRLSFARIGASGASFGPLQADSHAWPPALAAIERICRAAAMPAEQLGRVLGILRRALPQGWPGAAADLAAVDAALGSTQGRAAVDQLMQTILDGLMVQLERCIAAAVANGSTITPAALIGMTVWINQDGPPTDLLEWLRGEPVELSGEAVPVLARGAEIGQPAWLSYYQRIPFVRQHAGQLGPMLQAITVGMKALGLEPPPAGAALAPPPQSEADKLNAAELAGTLKPAA